MIFNHRFQIGCIAAAVGVGTLAASLRADACGGFFCQTAQPINQAAERIIFADNGDETVTAVIQILYNGPSENFSWLLPISTVPKGDEDIGIASDLAFQRLQAATNPNYTMTVRVEGTCANNTTNGSTATSPGAGGASASGGVPPRSNGVMVEASGVVGPFNWAAISLDKSLEDPADAAVEWLQAHGYDVAPGAKGLLRPYLEDGLYLLALQLTKDADVGSIRPIKLTYAAKEPMIPIKLTAVAANADMGVMTWLLSDARGVPRNYNALELNEAKINWFNAASNYNDVVTAAADEAGGQGFVTEFAGQSSQLRNVVWTQGDESQWTSFKQGTFANFRDILDSSYGQWGSWDGFWDAVRATVTLPEDLAFADFKLCPGCYADRVTFSPSAYVAAIEKSVIAPVREVQKLLDAHAYTTRLYTTMSAEEMTADPSFTFNPDLEDVSNLHTAERVIECNPKVNQFQAPWRVELPQGDVVRGTGSTWPGSEVAQPSNYRVVRQGESGPGKVLEDNSAAIDASLEKYNATMGSPASGGSGNASSTGGMTGSGAQTAAGGTKMMGSGGAAGSGAQPATGGTTMTGGGASDNGSGNTSSGDAGGSGSNSSSGCNLALGGSGPNHGWLISGLLVLGALRRRRNR